MNKIVLDEGISHLWLWEQPEKLRCWLDLMFMADAEGRVETSIRELGKRWKMPRQTIYKMLNDFQATKLLTIAPAKNGTILSLGRGTPFGTPNTDNYQQVTEEHGTPFGTPLQNNTSGTPFGTPFGTPNTDNYQQVTEERGTPFGTQNGTPKKESSPHTPYKEKNTTTTTNNNARTCVREGSRPAETQKSYEQDSKMIDSLLRSESWVEMTCMKKRIGKLEFVKRINDFRDWLFSTQHPGHSNVQDLLTHFWMWVDIQKQKEQDAEDRRNNKQKQFLTADDKCRLSAERATRETYARLGIEPPANVLAAMRGDYDGYDEPEHLE